MPRYTIGDNFNPKHSITNQWWGLGLYLHTMIITIYTSYTSNATGSKPGCYKIYFQNMLDVLSDTDLEYNHIFQYAF